MTKLCLFCGVLSKKRIISAIASGACLYEKIIMFLISAKE